MMVAAHGRADTAAVCSDMSSPDDVGAMEGLDESDVEEAEQDSGNEDHSHGSHPVEHEPLTRRMVEITEIDEQPDLRTVRRAVLPRLEQIKRGQVGQGACEVGHQDGDAAARVAERDVGMQREAGGDVANGRRDHDKPRADKAERRYHSCAVDLIVEGKRSSVEEELVLGNEGSRQRRYTDDHVGHGEGDEPDVDRLVTGLHPASDPLASEDKDVEHVTEYSETAECRKQNGLDEQLVGRIALKHRHNVVLIYITRWRQLTGNCNRRPGRHNRKRM